MEGDDSQKLQPPRGTVLLSGAQQTSGSLRNQHSNSNAGSPKVPISIFLPDLFPAEIGGLPRDARWI